MIPVQRITDLTKVRAIRASGVEVIAMIEESARSWKRCKGLCANVVISLPEHRAKTA